MDPQVLDLQRFAKRILELLGVDGGTAELEVQKLRDGSVRIMKEAVSSE